MADPKSDGEPIMIGHFEEGKKHGKFEQWYDDGHARHRELIATFDQDKYIDDYKEWYENGNKSIMVFILMGKNMVNILSGMRMARNP